MHRINNFINVKNMETKVIYPKINGVTYITQKQLCERTGYGRHGLRQKMAKIGIEPFHPNQKRTLYPLDQVEQAINDGQLIKWL